MGAERRATSWLADLKQELERLVGGDVQQAIRIAAQEQPAKEVAAVLERLRRVLLENRGASDREHRTVEQLDQLADETASLAEQLRTGTGKPEVSAALLESEFESVANVARAINSMVAGVAERAALAERVDTYHESTMELALGLSEAFQVLAALRAGDLEARIGDQMLGSNNELLVKLAEAINATAADQAKVIRGQEQAIQELSNPILQVWDNVLAIPIVGIVDSTRTADVMDRLLAAVVETESKCVIIDITGVDVVDTRTADNFIKMVKAAELVGARCVLTGISPAVAQTLVDIGVDLGSVLTLRNLEEGLRECIRFLEGRAAASLKARGRPKQG